MKKSLLIFLFFTFCSDGFETNTLLNLYNSLNNKDTASIKKFIFYFDNIDSTEFDVFFNFQLNSSNNCNLLKSPYLSLGVIKYLLSNNKNVYDFLQTKFYTNKCQDIICAMVIMLYTSLCFGDSTILANDFHLRPYKQEERIPLKVIEFIFKTHNKYNDITFEKGLFNQEESYSLNYLTEALIFFNVQFNDEDFHKVTKMKNDEICDWFDQNKEKFIWNVDEKKYYIKK